MRLRRSPIVIGATIAGVAAVLSYQPHAPSAGHGVQPAGIVATAPPPAGQQPAAARPNGTTVVGADAPNQFGDVQVRVKVTGGKITAIDAVALPGGDSRSQEISASAGPILARQALVAQNANIDGVSGASYTSAGYRRSLQSALDQLGRVNRPPAPA